MAREILITGEKGFIGGATARGFVQKGVEYISFDGDIREASDWNKNLTSGNIVLLIAGVRTETSLDIDVNYGSVEAFFNAITKYLDNKPHKVILASSQAVYMGNVAPFTEGQVPNPTTIYGESKIMAEKSATDWCKELSIPLVILRYSTVLGEGVREKSRMSGPLFAWTKDALLGLPIKVFQDGSQKRDYIHIDDVVAANIYAAKELDGGIYNVGGGVSVEVRMIAEWIKDAATSSSQIVIMGGESSSSDPRIMFSDISKLSKHGWKPNKTAKRAVNEFVASVRKST